MSIYHASITVDHKPEAVWNYLVDPFNASRWIYGAPQFELLDPGATAIGTRFKLTYPDYPMLVQVDGLVADRELRFRFIEGPAAGIQRVYRLAPMDGRTRLESDLTISLKGAWKLAFPLLVFREWRDRGYSITKIAEELGQARTEGQPEHAEWMAPMPARGEHL